MPSAIQQNSVPQCCLRVRQLFSRAGGFLMKHVAEEICGNVPGHFHRVDWGFTRRACAKCLQGLGRGYTLWDTEFLAIYDIYRTWIFADCAICRVFPIVLSFMLFFILLFLAIYLSCIASLSLSASKMHENWIVPIFKDKSSCMCQTVLVMHSV